MLTRTSDYDSVGEKAYRRIRTDIIFGKLAPGREAEARPAARGLRRERQHAARAAQPAGVRRAGGRRRPARVRGRAGVGGEPARDRGAAAAAGVARAARNRSRPATWIGRGASSPPITSFRRSRRSCVTGDRADPETWKRYDWEFHHALISACGSNALLETHAPVYDKYLRYQMIAGIFRGEIAAHEHQKLLECALSARRQDARATCW